MSISYEPYATSYSYFLSSNVSLGPQLILFFELLDMVPIFFLPTSDPISKIFIVQHITRKQYYLEVEITYFITTIFCCQCGFK